jgi:hypothetical protein
MASAIPPVGDLPSSPPPRRTYLITEYIPGEILL